MSVTDHLSLTTGDPVDRSDGHRSEREAGSGISLTKTVSVASLVDAHGNLDSQPWFENRSMIVELFSPILARSRQCPGRDAPQCCGAAEGSSCRPQWIEREDPEWYAQKINIYLTLVDARIRAQGNQATALAADEAFELGQLFTEALLKFQFDQAVKRSRKVTDGAQLGGDTRRFANRRRANSAETVIAVERNIERGLPRTRAYAAVAEDQGVDRQTIAKEYRRAKNTGRPGQIPFATR